MSNNNQIYEEIRANLKHLQQSKQEHTRHTNCDWLFDNLKDDIKVLVEEGFSLTAIIKAITSANVDYKYEGKPLKVTSAKLAVWLKANNIARKIHKRKAKKNVKKDVK